jgi:hypothetical protein
LSAYTGAWSTQVGPLLNVSTQIFAVGAMQSSEILGRVGARPFLVTVTNNTILSSGATTVTSCGMYDPDGTWRALFPVNNQGPTHKLRLDGVLGTFSSSTFDGSGKPTNLVFTPDVGQLSTNRIITPETATSAGDADQYRYRTVIACMGQNDLTLPDVVISNFQALRRWSLAAQARVLFITPPGGPGNAYGQTSNPTAFARLRKIELAALDLFGEACIVSRLFLMRYGDGGATDNAAIADGRVPPSITADSVHWVAETGHAYIAAEAARKIIRLGWSS